MLMEPKAFGAYQVIWFARLLEEGAKWWPITPLVYSSVGHDDMELVGVDYQQTYVDTTAPLVIQDWGGDDGHGEGYDDALAAVCDLRAHAPFSRVLL